MIGLIIVVIGVPLLLTILTFVLGVVLLVTGAALVLLGIGRRGAERA